MNDPASESVDCDHALALFVCEWQYEFLDPDILDLALCITQQRRKDRHAREMCKLSRDLERPVDEEAKRQGEDDGPVGCKVTLEIQEALLCAGRELGEEVSR